jgi:hypothetical protein
VDAVLILIQLGGTALAAFLGIVLASWLTYRHGFFRMAEVLRVAPDEVLIVNVSLDWSPEAARGLADNLRKLLPTRSMVLRGSSEFAVAERAPIH